MSEEKQINVVVSEGVPVSPPKPPEPPPPTERERYLCNSADFGNEEYRTDEDTEK